MFIFDSEQKRTIEFLVDKESSRSHLLWCIRDCFKDDDSVTGVFDGLTDEQINEGITDMVNHGQLTEGSLENEIHYGMIVVTEWMPNTARYIREENEAVKRDPQKYERKRQMVAEEKRLEEIEKEKIKQELLKRIENRHKWRVKNGV